ncbi:MAG: hypothetical protein WC454_07195 [Phycisphaerae bacterium]
MENTEKKVREQVLYDTETMVVTRWGARWAYWRYDVSNVPEEVKLFALQGFIDTLQDCTTAIKKADYKDLDIYRLDCQHKRRELERNINLGLKPIRSNTSEKAVEKKQIATLKEHTKVVSLDGLMSKKTYSMLDKSVVWTPEDEEKLNELFMEKMRLEGKNA